MGKFDPSASPVEVDQKTSSGAGDNDSVLKVVDKAAAPDLLQGDFKVTKSGLFL